MQLEKKILVQGSMVVYVCICMCAAKAWRVAVISKDMPLIVCRNECTMQQASCKGTFTELNVKCKNNMIVSQVKNLSILYSHAQA